MQLDFLYEQINILVFVCFYRLGSKYFRICLFLQIRLSGDVSDDVDEDFIGNKVLWDRGLLNGVLQKVSLYLLLSFEKKNFFVKFYII